MASDRSVVAYLARVWSDPAKGRILRTLAWGDVVSFVERKGKNLVVDVTAWYREPDGGILARTSRGYIRHGGRPTAKVLGPVDHAVLSVEFVDVQQGDAAVVQSPKGSVMLLDGGANKLFARYLANRFRDTTAQQPLPVEAIVVSHGDADHFAGLPLILESEGDPRPGKSIFLAPRAIYHNGLVKRPASVGEAKAFGPTVASGGDTWVTGLVDDLRTVPRSEMNRPFRDWVGTIEAWATRSPVTMRRLQRGSTGAFDAFASEGISVEVLGPEVRSVVPDGGGPAVDGLRFLRQPTVTPSSTGEPKKGALSASHTINGHSLVLRISYGNCRLLFAGDLNEEAEADLHALDQARSIELESDVFKVPHHGSADFGDAFLGDVTPLVSVVSSGDESARVEYIHPRATLMGALGRHSRIDRPLVFVTELVAFFAVEGYVGPEFETMTPLGTKKAKVARAQVADLARRRYFSFSRSAYGTVHVRTDGRQLLVYTDSALVKLKEAYRVDLTGPMPVLRDVDPI